MPTRPHLPAALVAAALVFVSAGRMGATAATVLPDVLEPAGTGGLEAVDRALAKLSTHRRLLVVGAHPDDEDTSALALVARELGGEAAYLALSRGEGGQNLIGPELGEALGVLRTRELLAARQVDGARQYFTRAYDFGYTRSLEETLRLWPREALLEDAVRVVRRFQPQVILSVFGDDGSGGHGQHQAAGHIAYAAFRSSGDASARLDGEGLPPWRAQALYRAAWFAPERATAAMPLGGIDSWSGHSMLQLAQLSRSQHRSQDMGRLLELGPRDGKFTWVEGAAGREGKELFAGIDTHLRALADLLPAGRLRDDARRALDAVETSARSVREQLTAARPAPAAAGLAQIRRRLRQLLVEVERATAGAGEGRDPGVVGFRRLLGEKVAVAEAGLLAARGIALDAQVDREELVAGEAAEVTAVLFNAGTEPLRILPPEARLRGALVELRSDADLPEVVAPGTARSWKGRVEIPAASAPTRPYYLARARAGALYDWSEAAAETRGEPFQPGDLQVRFRFVAGEAGGDDRFELEREVVYRFADQARGEIRRPLRIVPPVEVEVDREMVLVTPARPRAEVEVRLRSNAATPVAGELRARTDCASAAPATAPIELAPGAAASFRFALGGCAGSAAAEQPVRFVAHLTDGREVDLALPLVEHPHVRPTPLPRPAGVAVVATDLALPALARVGYVPGASDRLPGLLAEVGVPIETVTAEILANGDLGRFDAIVVGTRAYETEPALARQNRRLLDYVRAGGLAIVLYQQYPFVEAKLAPFPLEIGRPHDRVTDESSPVAPLAPEHPVFTTPNRLTAEDWRGWVQERALYLPKSWDRAYLPLVELGDPGEPPQRGALLAARLGRGTYLYSGLAFFRQLPAGVAGAYRLFANLLALAREGRAASDRALAAHELAQRLLVVDTHIDLPYRLQEKKEDPAGRTGGDFDYPRARDGGLDVAFMSIYVPASYQKAGGARELADQLIDGVEAIAAAAPEKWALARSPAEVAANQAAGRISLALGMENGAPVGDDLANLGHFFDRGVRYVTLTHAEDNQICDSSYSKPGARTWQGLSPFGRTVVAEMNRLGILVDLAHVSDQAFDQAIEIAAAPPIVSHSSCRHFTPGFERNLDDERIRKLAAKGGVIQINFGSGFLTAAANVWSEAFWTAREAFVAERKLDEHAPEVEEWERRYREERPFPRATLDDVVAHIDHVVHLVGIEHVGLGSDFDGVGDSLPEGLRDASMYPNLFAKLLERGYTESDLERLAGGNLLRVWRAAEAVAARLQAAAPAPRPGGPR